MRPGTGRLAPTILRIASPYVPRMSLSILLAVMLVITILPLAAQDRDVILRAEFPADSAAPPSLAGFEGVPDPAFVARIPDKDVARTILEEARWVFGGMVWGFSYTYTPSDKARSISEYFKIEPLTELSWSAPGLKVISARLDGTFVYAAVEWVLGDAERAELAAWRGIRFAAGQGRASARAFMPSPAGADFPGAAVIGRRDAMIAAAREALREYLRGIEHNKPREVRGSFAFASPPRMTLAGGAWTAVVRILIAVDHIESYGAY